MEHIGRRCTLRRILCWAILVICLCGFGIQPAHAGFYVDPFAVRITANLTKGQRLSEAVEKIFASAKEFDQTELDPSKKGFGIFKHEVREKDLVLSKDVDLIGIRFDEAIRRLCEASGAVLRIEDPDLDASVKERRFLFFRNNERAVHDRTYEIPPSLADHLNEKIKALGLEPQPGEGILYKGPLRIKMVRGSNAYHLAVAKEVKKALAEEPPLR